MDTQIQIRRAQITDAEKLYNLGLATPELQVSATEVFMDREEFDWSITNDKGVFLLAEQDDKVAGFIYANSDDKEKPFKNRYACLVYLVVAPEYRKQGVAQELFEQCQITLRDMGLTHLYGWANIESDGSIVSFMKKQGFEEGHTYMWMDKKI